jgi:hypothetical protein
MNGYQVFVNGKNFLVEFDTGLEKHGFYTNVYVQAKNEEQAEYAAMDLLRQHKSLRGYVQNEKADPPTMFAEEILEISNYDEIEPKLQGLSWYLEKDDESA